MRLEHALIAGRGCVPLPSTQVIGRFIAARCIGWTPSRTSNGFPGRDLKALIPASTPEELDALGDHRAACATAGVLPARAIPLERALARVCREAGPGVAQNVRLADMNVDAPVRDARRIEVVCNGLPLWDDAQLAVDATIVSPSRPAVLLGSSKVRWENVVYKMSGVYDPIASKDDQDGEEVAQ